MSDDQDVSKAQTGAEGEKPDKKAVLTKLLLLVAIVFALTKWGLPFMHQMVDEFKETQNGEEEVDSPEEKPTESDVEKSEEIELSDEEKLKLVIEDEINLWIKKESPLSSAEVKFVNLNADGSKLAVEYLEKSEDGDEESKELVFIKDEFGIFVYLDEAGVRRIRIRQPE